jgi:hypothetical protein
VYALLITSVDAYSTTLFRSHVRCYRTASRFTSRLPLFVRHAHDTEISDNTFVGNDTINSRRSFVASSLMVSSVFATSAVKPVQASVGTLPEFADTNTILQGITIRVADQSQQQAMIGFLEDGFDCEVIRKRITGSIEETWLGFGPEQLNIPNDFQLPISSFAKYGGHASIHLIYDTKATSPYYRIGDNAPGNNIAYLQLGVPVCETKIIILNMDTHLHVTD